MEHGAVKNDVGGNDSFSKYCDEYDLFCEGMSKGRIWLGLGITSTVLGIFAWFAILRELRKDSKPIAMSATILFSVICTLNVIVYLAADDGLSECA